MDLLIDQMHGETVAVKHLKLLAYLPGAVVDTDSSNRFMFGLSNFGVTCKTKTRLNWVRQNWSRNYYIKTSEIPSELSCENFISSHVKITCILDLHTRRDHHRYGHIINRAFFTGVYTINRILHARLWI